MNNTKNQMRDKIFENLKDHFKTENTFRIIKSNLMDNQIIIDNNKERWKYVSINIYDKSLVIRVPNCSIPLGIDINSNYISIIRNIFRNLNNLFEYYNDIINEIYHKYHKCIRDYNTSILHIKGRNNNIVCIYPTLHFDGDDGSIKLQVEINRINSDHRGQTLFLPSESGGLFRTIDFFLE